MCTAPCQVWLLRGKQDEMYRSMWETAMDEMIAKMLYQSQGGTYTYITEITRWEGAVGWWLHSTFTFPLSFHTNKFSTLQFCHNNNSIAIKTWVLQHDCPQEAPKAQNGPSFLLRAGHAGTGRTRGGGDQ